MAGAVFRLVFIPDASHTLSKVFLPDCHGFRPVPFIFDGTMCLFAVL